MVPSSHAVAALLLGTGLLASIATIGATLQLLRSLRRPRPLRLRLTFASLLLGVLSMCAVGDFLHGMFAASDAELPVTNLSSSRRRVPERLRIISFNVLLGYPDFHRQEERYQLALDAFRALEPDILILQESWRTRTHGDLAERLAHELGMNVTYSRANGSLRFIGFEEGSAILSRYPIKTARRIVLHPRKHFWESRIALVATLEVGSEEVTVVGTHLAVKSLSVARRQAESLLKRAPAAACVAGDFNAPSGSAVLEVFESRGMTDVLLGGIDHVVFDNSWLANWNVRRAVWTLREREMEVLVGRPVRISDHPGLLIDLEKIDTQQPPRAAERNGC